MSDTSRAATDGSADTARAAPRLGIIALTAFVVGSMIGGGVFSLPQNMAAGAAPAAILVGWLVTGVGMLALAFVYQNLASRKPDLDSGPYAYARAGFGDYVGFNSAWGYWLSAWLGNVSYAVLIFGTLGQFFPFFGSGNTLPAILGASVVVWAVHFLILSGIRQAAVANVITTVAKLVPLFLFIVLAIAAFNIDTFSLDLRGTGTPDLGGVMNQVKNTMLVTLWVFIGIEGASVVSARAARRADIGRATVMGFLLTLTVYLLVSLLSLGVMTQPELAALPDTASMANVLGAIAGPWGDAFVRLGLMVSVLGAYLAWTLFAAEIPYVAAREGILPRVFALENQNGSPSGSLWITSAMIQVFLIVTYFSEATYTGLFYIASTAILVPYVLSGAYAVKISLSGETYAGMRGARRDLLFGAIATLYGAWLVYAAGLSYLLMCGILYAAGIPLYLLARHSAGARLFDGWEWLLAVALLLAAAIAAWMMWTGAISPL